MEVDLSRLIRDYNENPICGGRDRPPYEDFHYLYIELNLTATEVAEIIGVPKSKIHGWIAYFKIKKSKDKQNESSKNYWLKKYGVDNPRKCKEIQEKTKRTNLERYGHECAMHNAKIKENMIKNNIEKYGVEYAGASKSAIEKRAKSNLTKYGFSSPFQRPEVKDLIKKTNVEKYGVEYATQSEVVKQKTINTNMERYGVPYVAQSLEVKNRTLANNLEKYGVENPMQLDEVKQKVIETNLKRYGSKASSQNEQVKEKAKQTNLKRFGKEYPIQLDEFKNIRRTNNIAKWGTSNISNKHIDPKVLEILNDDNKFKWVLEQNRLNTINSIAEYFGISYSGAYLKVMEHQCNEMITKFISKPEHELSELLPQFSKNRKVISPYEIDLYNDSYNLGIEFNGDYWHSELNKPQDYHKNKSLFAASKGVFIYHIFEHEWNNPNKKKIILSQINNLTKMNKNNIGARSCTISKLDSKECNTFLLNNHLQGPDKASIRYGLYYRNELVCVMTFCKPRFNKNYDWELSRFCSKLNINVIGGASKLFRYFLKNHKGNIITYSDLSKGAGNLYDKLGFEYVNLTKPNYIWSNGFESYTRYQTQKHKLKDYYNYGNTEIEIMHNRGFFRIFDCGNKVWVYHN